MIEGVITTPLKQIPDDRGMVMHMLRRDSKNFSKFGEIYFSTDYPDKVKGWHLHKKMTLNYAVIFGEIKLVLYDVRPNSKTKGEIQEFFLSESIFLKISTHSSLLLKFINSFSLKIILCAGEYSVIHAVPQSPV